ncbi:hypothetical protein D9M71_800260 [compost metagenome]
MRNSLDVVDGHVLFTALQHSHVGAVHSGALGKQLLRYPLAHTLAPHIVCEHFDQKALIGLERHAATFVTCILSFYIL